MSIRKKQSDITKNVILEAATELFMNNGYPTVSTKSIAKEASSLLKTKYKIERSISKASIFNHFSSKEQLAIQVLNKLYVDVDNIVDQSLLMLSDDANIISLFEAMIFEILTYFVKYPLMTQFTFQLIGEIENEKSGDEIKDIFQFYMEKYSTEFNKLLHNLGISETEEKTRIFMALIDGLAMHLSIAQIGPGDPTITKLSKEIVVIIKNWQIQEGKSNE